MEDTELWRWASIMLERRGIEATAECERLADQLERDDRREAAAEWRQVAAAVDELLRGIEKRAIGSIEVGPMRTLFIDVVVLVLGIALTSLV